MHTTKTAVRSLVAIAALGVALAWPAPAAAQITPTYTFTAGTTIDPDQMNANFALLANALNRTGGTMTGTLTSRSIIPSADATYDLGSSGTKFRNAYFSGDVTVAGTLTATLAATSLTCTGCVGATELASTTVAAGTYGSATKSPVIVVDADGRVTGVTEATITQPTVTGLGAGVSKSIDTVYTAATDGFLVVKVEAQAGTAVYAQAFSDAANPPTTEVGFTSAQNDATPVTVYVTTMTIPILKGKNYEVTRHSSNADLPIVTITFYPSGS